MKETLSVMFASFFFILAIPLAYGQQPFDTGTTNINTNMNQTMDTTTGTSNTPEATIGKSENLTITDLRFRADSNQITGTVINNSTNEQSSITIYVVLFDKDDSFLGIAQGRPLVESLPPADNSPFSIDLYSGFGLFAIPEEVKGIDHYTIYVRGYEPFF